MANQSEEQITKLFMSWLLDEGFTIVCFDFPQSGTGKRLHPDNAKSEKNKDSIIPDIVAVKAGVALFFENKSFYYENDFKKCYRLITTSDYKKAISILLDGHNVDSIFYGIGLPESCTEYLDSLHLVNFVYCLTDDGAVKRAYEVDSLKAKNLF